MAENAYSVCCIIELARILACHCRELSVIVIYIVNFHYHCRPTHIPCKCRHDVGVIHFNKKHTNGCDTDRDSYSDSYGKRIRMKV